MKSKDGVYRPLFRQKSFMKMMIGYNISRLGDSLDAIVFSWIMYEVTGNASMLALILAVNFLPTVLLQPFAAVWSGRLPKVSTIVVCNTCRFLTVAITAGLYTFGLLNVPILFLFTLLNSTVEAFEAPASSALSPMILPKELYATGASFRTAVSRIVELVGMACAGGLIGLIGSTSVLLIDAVSFLICAACIATIRVTEETTGTAEKNSYFRELKAGVAYAFNSSVVRMLLMLGMFLNFSAIPLNSFQTVFVADTLKMGPELLSAGGVAMTAAMGFGAFAVPHLLKKIPRKILLIISAIMTNAAYCCFAAAVIPTETLWKVVLLLSGVLLMGLFSGMISPIFGSIFMEQVEAEYMARVSGLTNAVLTSMMPVGSLLCAGLALFLPLEVIFWVSSILLSLLFLPIAFMKGYRQI